MRQDLGRNFPLPGHSFGQPETGTGSVGAAGPGPRPDGRRARDEHTGYSAFSRYADMLEMNGIPAKGHTVAELEQALRGEIERLKTELVSAEELQRVQAQVVASQVYELDSVFYQAMQIGTLETVGLDWRLVDSYPEKMKAVTAEQVRAVAQKYLTDDSLTVAVLEPLPLENENQVAAPVAGGDYVR